MAPMASSSVSNMEHWPSHILLRPSRDARSLVGAPERKVRETEIAFIAMVAIMSRLENPRRCGIWRAPTKSFGDGGGVISGVSLCVAVPRSSKVLEPGAGTYLL